MTVGYWLVRYFDIFPKILLKTGFHMIANDRRRSRIADDRKETCFHIIADDRKRSQSRL